MKNLVVTQRRINEGMGRMHTFECDSAKAIGRTWRPIKYACLTMCVRVLSHSVVSDFVTPWTAPRQAPLSMGFSRDGGAWWAAVCGVTQSWTRLK